MEVQANHAAGMVEHKGHTYYFCSDFCVKKFKAGPDQYTGRAGSPRAAVQAPHTDTAEYTCPMDPEVREQGPGPCPKCGMAVGTGRYYRTGWLIPNTPSDAS